MGGNIRFPFISQSQSFKPTATPGALPLDTAKFEVIAAQFREHFRILDVGNSLEIGVAPIFVMFVEFARRRRSSRVCNQTIIEVSRDAVGLQFYVPFLEFEFGNLIVAHSLNPFAGGAVGKGKSYGNKLRDFCIHPRFYF